MRIVLQRVSRASVTIGGSVVGSIGRGYCVLAGFHADDGPEQVDWMAAKVAGLRLFADDAGKMNLALADVGGAVLVVSQFTLYGDAEKGRRPSFIAAAGEVEEVLEVSLDDLRDASRIRRGTRVREGVAVEYPYFDLLGHHVWGATAMILGEFICLL